MSCDRLNTKRRPATLPGQSDRAIGFYKLGKPREGNRVLGKPWEGETPAELRSKLNAEWLFRLGRSFVRPGSSFPGVKQSIALENPRRPICD